jgi:hypothetical protein
MPSPQGISHKNPLLPENSGGCNKPFRWIYLLPLLSVALGSPNAGAAGVAGKITHRGATTTCRRPSDRYGQVANPTSFSPTAFQRTSDSPMKGDVPFGRGGGDCKLAMSPSHILLERTLIPPKLPAQALIGSGVWPNNWCVVPDWITGHPAFSNAPISENASQFESGSSVVRSVISTGVGQYP